jgi:hypothetical protein
VYENEKGKENKYFAENSRKMLRVWHAYDKERLSPLAEVYSKDVGLHTFIEEREKKPTCPYIPQLES